MNVFFNNNQSTKMNFDKIVAILQILINIILKKVKNKCVIANFLSRVKFDKRKNVSS